MTFAVRWWPHLAILSLLASPLVAFAEDHTNPLRRARLSEPQTLAPTTPTFTAEESEADSLVSPASEPALFTPVTAAGHREQVRQVAGRFSKRLIHAPPQMISEEIILGEPGTFISSQEPMPESVEGEIIDAGEVIMETDTGLCEDCGTLDCNQCCMLPCPSIPWHRLEFFSGATGFIGSANRGQGASFGFHQGINMGAPVSPYGASELGMQIGARFVESNLSGSSFTDNSRNQTFLTAGLFHRVDWGFQGGIVFDYMSDNWNYGIELSQLRGEMSWMCTPHQDLGFQFTTNMKTDTSETLLSGQLDSLTETWESVDLYAFFYRTSFMGDGASGTIRAGWTGLSTALLASELQVPVTDNLALRASYTYLIPNEEDGVSGADDEVWNVAMGIVWYPGCGRARTRNYYQPLLPVADNGSFISHRP